MERGGVDETRGQVIGRRLKTVPGVTLGLVAGAKRSALQVRSTP